MLNLDDAHVTVIMYSKFSPACTSFLEILSKVPTFKHTLLCVDNEEIRKRVLSDSKLTISEIPCLFRIYERTGYVESFEGERAFTILNTHYNHYLEKMERDQLLRSQPQPQMSQMSQLPTPVQQTQALPPPVQQTQPLPSKSQAPIQIEKDVTSQPPLLSSNFSSPIEDIPDIPDISTSTNISNMSGMGGGMDRAVKTGAGGGNIVSRAMQMQKERESDAPAPRTISQ